MTDTPSTSKREKRLNLIEDSAFSLWSTFMPVVLGMGLAGNDPLWMRGLYGLVLAAYSVDRVLTMRRRMIEREQPQGVLIPVQIRTEDTAAEHLN